MTSAGLVLSLPGGLFELAFGLWLIAKGFKSFESAPRSAPAGPVQPTATSMAPAR